MLIFLWCVPRSVSTAFEKMMWHSGEFEVVSEPFIDLYKQSFLSDTHRSEVGEKVVEVCNKLLNRSKHRAVFVKDMGYHAEPFITDEFIIQAKHTFLIRDPNLTIPSLHRMREEYTEDQTGFEGLLTLFNRVKQLTDRTPFVMDAEDLLRTPEAVVANYFDSIGIDCPKDILTWPKGSNKAWKGREEWHLDAIESEGFVKRPGKNVNKNKPRKVEGSIAIAEPYYFELLKNT